MAGERILVIEDNAKNRKLVRDVLQFHGYTIVEAETAEAGVQMVRDLQPHLILMDVQLPGMDGLSALRLIKSDEHTQQIPILALTAYAMKGDQERFLAAGFDGYIDKPIDLKMFVATVQRYLSGIACSSADE